MKIKLLISVCLALIVQGAAQAQFYSVGSDPGSLRWRYVESENYRIIYPEGLDSLAGVYARNLENVRRAVGSGTAFLPNENYNRRMPVILHSYTADANGVVTWAPRRMDLYTTPDANIPDPTPWPLQLAVHESRHVSQMQLGSSKTFKWLKYPLGELVDGALAAVYGGPVFFEGDAVISETANTMAGRGRNGDFLEYYRASFGKSAERDWFQWLYGSQKFYSPSHYALGYLTLAGASTLYDTNISKNFYERIRKKHGISLLNLPKTISEASGKSFRNSFREISSFYADQWQLGEDVRAPFQNSEAVTATKGKFVRYEGLVVRGNDIFAVKSGLNQASSLVKIDAEGVETRIAAFSGSVSRLRFDAVQDRIYWAERRQDMRWEMRSFSEIRYLDASGKIRTLTRGTRYYNPGIGPDGRIAVAEYTEDGRSAAVILDAEGNETARYQAPDGVQILEPLWCGEKLFVSALTDAGTGIFTFPEMKAVLPAQHSRIGDLKAAEDRILFTSDLNGVSELYSLDPSDGSVLQLTATENGSHDFCSDGEYLYFTAMKADGKNVYRSSFKELNTKPADFSNPRSHAVADYLSSRQETEIEDADVVLSEPKRYSKAAHLFRFHSWAPVFVDFNSISSLSMDNVWQKAGLGATGFFQNDLGTASGSVAYHANPNSGKWRHSGHLKFKYSGWYPVIEAAFDFNASNKLYYSRKAVVGGMTMRTQDSGKPGINFSLKTYVPLNFSSGGWNRGVIPQLNFNLSNSLFGKYTTSKTFLSTANMSRLTASLRAYSMMRIPSSCIYPRWGVGVEFGYSFRPLLDDVFCSTAYTYVYGYVPGLLPTHGIRLSSTAAFRASDALFCEETVKTAPRGFNSVASSYIGRYPTRARFTFDYAFPFACVDWSGFSPIAYVRNFEMTAHADLSLFGGENLFSVGADLAVRLGNLLWLPFASRIGVSYDYNGGSAFSSVESYAGAGRNTISLLLSVDF